LAIHSARIFNFLYKQLPSAGITQTQVQGYVLSPTGFGHP
jgi:hypothetical protein